MNSGLTCWTHIISTYRKRQAFAHCRDFQVVINQRLDDKLNPVDPAALAVALFEDLG